MGILVPASGDFLNEYARKSEADKKSSLKLVHF